MDRVKGRSRGQAEAFRSTTNLKFIFVLTHTHTHTPQLFLISSPAPEFILIICVSELKVKCFYLNRKPPTVFRISQQRWAGRKGAGLQTGEAFGPGKAGVHLSHLV